MGDLHMSNLKKNLVKGFSLGLAIVFSISNICYGYPVNSNCLRPPMGQNGMFKYMQNTKGIGKKVTSPQEIALALNDAAKNGYEVEIELRDPEDFATIETLIGRVGKSLAGGFYNINRHAAQRTINEKNIISVKKLASGQTLEQDSTREALEQNLTLIAMRTRKTGQALASGETTTIEIPEIRFTSGKKDELISKKQSGIEIYLIKGGSPALLSLGIQAPYEASGPSPLVGQTVTAILKIDDSRQRRIDGRIPYNGWIIEHLALSNYLDGKTATLTVTIAPALASGGTIATYQLGGLSVNKRTWGEDGKGTLYAGIRIMDDRSDVVYLDIEYHPTATTGQLGTQPDIAKVTIAGRTKTPIEISLSPKEGDSTTLEGWVTCKQDSFTSPINIGSSVDLSIELTREGIEELASGETTVSSLLNGLYRDMALIPDYDLTGMKTSLDRLIAGLEPDGKSKITTLEHLARVLNGLLVEVTQKIQEFESQLAAYQNTGDVDFQRRHYGKEMTILQDKLNAIKQVAGILNLYIAKSGEAAGAAQGPALASGETTIEISNIRFTSDKLDDGVSGSKDGYTVWLEKDFDRKALKLRIQVPYEHNKPSVLSGRQVTVILKGGEETITKTYTAKDENNSWVIGSLVEATYFNDYMPQKILDDTTATLTVTISPIQAPALSRPAQAAATGL